MNYDLICSFYLPIWVILSFLVSYQSLSFPPGKCLQNLEDAEFYLAQTYIEHGKFLPIYEELEEEEKQNSKQKVVKANARIKKEMANAIAIERRKKSKDKEHISTVCGCCNYALND